MSQSTIILRFRDLVIPTPGDTIAEHQRIIDQHGYTWWGWWKKQAEKVPEGLWSTIIRQLDAKSPGEIYLLDSGQRRLYRADLLEVKFDPGRDEAPAPENGEKTPAYYGKSIDGKAIRFASWFKIKKIAPVDEAVLHELAYEQPPHDDLVQVAPDQIVDRRIEKIAELLLFGNVTYWVAKLATAESKSAGQIHVRIPPAIAPDIVIVAQSPIILHISDLHYHKDHHAFRIGADDDHNPGLARAIVNTLLRDKAFLPGLVVVTGDLTWTGAPEEFEAVFDGLDFLRSQLGLTRQHFIIVPGNHDLGWVRVGEGAGGWNGRYEMARLDAKTSYEAFFRRWYETAPDKHLRIGRRFFVYGGPTLDILGFNSSSLQQVKDEFQGMGRIPDAHYEDAARLMNWNADARRPAMRRVVLTHHHLLPVVSLEHAEYSKRGFGIALDAGQQLRLAAQYDVDLIVHGHQHHPFAGYFRSVDLVGAANARRGVSVLGGGSAGVNDQDLGPIHHRCFGLLDLGHDATRYQLFTTHMDGRRFDPQSIVRLDGDGWVRVET